MIATIFNGCVDILNRLAARTEMTHDALSGWVLCVIWPLFTAGQIAVVVVQRVQLRARSWQVPQEHLSWINSTFLPDLSKVRLLN